MIGSLFSGIGGLELGLERAGLGPVVWQAERDAYCLAVLRRHWPHAHRYSDVKEVGRGSARVDVVCGGFPCQPVSLAGARLAQRDERWLWPEFARIIDEVCPGVVVVENVPGLRSAGLRDVLAGLADLGFDAEWTCLAAGEAPRRTHGWPHVGAPHERRRIFLVATHPDRVEVRGEPGWLARACWEGASVSRDAREARLAADAGFDARSERPDASRRWVSDVAWSGGGEDAERLAADSAAFGEFRGWASDSGWRHAPSPVRRVDDGLPSGLDGAIGDDERGACCEASEPTSQAPDTWRVMAGGNAVVVQCAEVIGRAIAANVRAA